MYNTLYAWILIAPAIFIAVMPALQYVVGDTPRSTFVMVPGEDSYPSVSTYISNAPAAGLFGFFIGSAITAAFFVPQLNVSWYQTLGIILLYLTNAFLVATPSSYFEMVHRASTILTFIAIVILSVLNFLVYRGSLAVFYIFFAVIICVVAITILRIYSDYMHIGYSFFVFELFLIVHILALIPIGRRLPDGDGMRSMHATTRGFVRLFTFQRK